MIQIADRNVFIIRCHSATFDISQKNSRPVRCADCHGRIQAGIGIYRRQFRHTGYVCFSCLRAQLRTSTFTISGDGDLGFIIGQDANLQACLTTPRKITTPEVINAVHAYLLDLGYDTADALIGDECANVWKIGDVAESILKTQ